MALQQQGDNEHTGEVIGWTAETIVPYSNADIDDPVKIAQARAFKLSADLAALPPHLRSEPQQLYTEDARMMAAELALAANARLAREA